MCFKSLHRFGAGFFCLIERFDAKILCGRFAHKVSSLMVKHELERHCQQPLQDVRLDLGSTPGSPQHSTVLCGCFLILLFVYKKTRLFYLKDYN